MPSAPPVGFVGEVAGMVVNVGAPAIRLWLLSTAGDRLIQVQRDRLVLNWRRGDAGQEYPHYDHLRPTYVAVYEDLQTFLAEEGFEAMKPMAVEVTYVNSIDVPSAELPRAVRSLARIAHPLGEPIETQLVQAWPGTSESTEPSMLTMTVNRSPLTRESVLLTLSSRSAVASSDPRRVFDAMEQGHRDVVLSFAAVTTDEMHTRWGRQS